MNNEESKGLRLLKQGQKGFFHLIFSRLGLIVLLLAFHIFLLFSVFHWFERFLPHIYGGAILLTVAMVLYLLNTRMDASAKITWLFVILLLPVFGALLFHEQIRLNQVIGCTLAVLGVVLFVQPEKDEKEDQP